MVAAARLERTGSGLVPRGEGWYVLNAREARWGSSDELGAYCTFEGDVRFPSVGVNVHVLRPGQPNGMYHAEDAQEDFLVLAGECVLVVEGEERHLRAWDFVHCPPGTEHIFVGAGAEPCVILMVGERRADAGIRYPVSEAAQRHAAGVERETTSPQEAYARFARPQHVPCPDGLLTR